MSLATCSQPYKNALEIQELLLKDMRAEETPPAVRAQQARAWKELEGLKRVMRGLAANTSQSIRSDPVKKSKQVQAAPMEWVEPEPAPVKPSGEKPTE